MFAALLATVGSFASFWVVVRGASVIARRHHYYEDLDEDKQGSTTG